jgi:beta-lactamase regulating signal transducer with metallopeptidase domain
MNLPAALLASAPGAALKVTLALGAATLAAAALRRASAAARHFVWSLAVAGALALLPISLAAPLLGPVPWSLSVAPGWEPAPEAPVGALDRSLPASEAKAAPTPGAPGLNPGKDRAGAAPLARGQAWAWLSWAAWLWALGAALLAARWLGALLGAASLRRRAVPASPEDPIRGALRDLARELGLRAAPPLRFTAEGLPPLTAGILRPAVLLPPSARTWTAERLRMVLLHELAHIRRRDCLTQTMAELLRALLWPHPLAHLAARQMRLLREAAADDLVLRSGARPSSYAGHLCDIAAALAPRRALPASLALGALGEGPLHPLSARVQALLDPGADRRPLRPRLAVPAAALCALGVPLLGTFTVSARKPAPVDSPPAVVPTGPAAPGSPAPLAALVREHLGRSLPGGLPAGAQIELTIDPAIQALAEAEIDGLFAAYHPAAASVVVLSPRSGEVLALAGKGGPALPPVQAAYDTGSTMKPLTVALALEQGAIRRDQTFFCENGAYPFDPGPGRSAPRGGKATMRDAAPHGTLSVAQVLAVSSNIGAVKIYQALGREAFLRGLGRLRFGQAPPVEVPGAAPGSSLALTDEVQVASVAAGEGLRASPLQVAAAFAALANDGTYLPPTLLRAVRDPDGSARALPPRRGVAVFSPATARAVLEMLEGVVHGPEGTGRQAAIPGQRVAGKTGTASRVGEGGAHLRDGYYASFIGAVPAERPRLVILVGVDGPRSVETGEAGKAGKAGKGLTGGVVAAPAFRRLGEKILARGI